MSDDRSIPIILSVLILALFIGWIFSLSQDPNITLSTVMQDYSTTSGAYTPGQAINNTPTGETSTLGSLMGFVFDIPVIGQIIGLITWIITVVIDMIVNVASIPSYFPSWMSPIFAVLFLGFIWFVYSALMPGKG